MCKPDAFVWWYVDLRCGEGTGLVLLWGVGIPFVKTKAPRSGALQLVFYERGRPEYYHLGTFEEFDSLSAEGSARFRGGTIDVSRERDVVRLTAQLDVESPFEDGFTLSLEFVGEKFEIQGTSSSAHRWAPQAVVARAKATLTFGSREVALEGPSYFDSNASLVPLAEQGFQAWRWGRIGFSDETWIFYEILREGDVVEDALVFRVGRENELVSRVGLSWERGVRAFYGLVSPRAGTMGEAPSRVDFEVEALVDDGPFYQRLLLRGVNGKGEVGYGFYEVVNVEKLDRRWHGPFINMRILRHDERANSFWLPLFRGGRSGRVRRLAKSILPASGGSTP